MDCQRQQTKERRKITIQARVEGILKTASEGAAAPSGDCLLEGMHRTFCVVEFGQSRCKFAAPCFRAVMLRHTIENLIQTALSCFTSNLLTKLTEGSWIDVGLAP